MVWFQCEDCGENLKKPKLANHFRICSAAKFSCIDCGEMFGQQAVQGHTQCITEAEKYGPKGQGRASNAPPAKSSNKDSKQQPDFDIKVGLSERPPWFCSLCNTKATSEQTLLLHAEGKKHRAKARAFHASKQPPKQGEGLAPNAARPSENGKTTETGGNEHVDEAKNKNVQKDHDPDNIAVGVENGSKKKRKHDASENVSPDADGNRNGEVVQAKTYDLEAKKAKKCTGTTEGTLHKMKWKRLIKSSLKTSSDGTMKIKKLKKLLVKVMKESGISVAETQLGDTLEQKINSSKRFIIDGKYVRLAVKG